jgi:hypothetical protein
MNWSMFIIDPGSTLRNVDTDLLSMLYDRPLHHSAKVVCRQTEQQYWPIAGREKLYEG